MKLLNCNVLLIPPGVHKLASSSTSTKDIALTILSKSAPSMRRWRSTPTPRKLTPATLQLWESNRASRSVLVSRLNFLDWREQGRSFDHMALYSGEPVTATGGELPQRTNATGVSRGFFEIFSAHAVLGRTFLPEDLQPSKSIPAVIGYGLWQRAFASDPKVIGKTVHISGIECHVIGVAQPGFQFPDNTGLWLPFEAFPDDGSDRSGHNYSVVGHLKTDIPAVFRTTPGLSSS